MVFKVGDRVKYIKASSFIEYNSVGIIRRVDKRDSCPYQVKFTLPNPLFWWCMESSIVRVPIKNEQLVFEFMRG